MRQAQEEESAKVYSQLHAGLSLILLGPEGMDGTMEICHLEAGVGCTLLLKQGLNLPGV